VWLVGGGGGGGGDVFALRVISCCPCIATI